MGCCASKSAQKAVSKPGEVPLEGLAAKLENKGKASPAKGEAPAIAAAPTNVDSVEVEVGSPAKAAASPAKAKDASTPAEASPPPPSERSPEPVGSSEEQVESAAEKDGPEEAAGEGAEAVETPKKDAGSFGGLTFDLDMEMPTLPTLPNMPAMPSMDLGLCKGCESYVTKLTSPRCNGKSAMSEVDTALTKNHITALLGQGLVTKEQYDQFLTQDQFYHDSSKHGYSPATTPAKTPSYAPMDSDRKIAILAREQSAAKEPEPEPAGP
jgi:hypothetical protein